MVLINLEMKALAEESDSSIRGNRPFYLIGKVCEVIFEVIEALSVQGMFSIHKGSIKGSVLW